MSTSTEPNLETVTLRRMLAESDKFVAEQRKLMAEAAKFERDHRLAPWALFGSWATAVAALIAGVVALVKVF